MTTTQQPPSNPAIDFANAILAETDNAREIINMLHDIAQGHRESSTASDRINASKILLDRGLGKCPKHLQIPSTESEPDPESAESDNHTNHSSDTSRSEPESPRLVTRLDDALHNSLGPAPSAETLPNDPTRHSGGGRNPEGQGGASHPAPDPFDPNSIHFTIQQHILDITNNCRTLNTALTGICRAPDDDPKVTDYHRVRAGQMLLDRILGTDPDALHNAVCPACRQSWTTHPGSSGHHQQSIVEEEPFDKEVWDEIIAKLKQLEEDGVITPDPDAPKIDPSTYMKWTDEEIAPYAKEVAAKFDAEIALRVERQKQWPEIEERRRKKLEQMYPSHSEDDEPPDT